MIFTSYTPEPGSEGLLCLQAGRPGLDVLEGCARALVRELQLEAQATGLDVHVEGRLKSLYSVHRKMARKGISLAEVFDARALRVVVSDADGQHQARRSRHARMQ